jgi:hypothetical protein
MEEDDEEEAGAVPVEDRERGEGNTGGVKPAESGGSLKPKSTIKKSKGKGGSKTSSHSSDVDRRDKQTVR